MKGELYTVQVRWTYALLGAGPWFGPMLSPEGERFMTYKLQLAGRFTRAEAATLALQARENPSVAGCDVLPAIPRTRAYSGARARKFWGWPRAGRAAP